MVIVAGILVVLLLVVWYVKLGFDVDNANDELAQVEASNNELRTQIAELQPFADLQAEVDQKREALVAVMAGDIDWPVLLTEVAMAVPGELWLTNLSASAGATEGAAPVGTETAPIRVSSNSPTGRIAFEGKSLSMPGVAKWLIRQEISERFEAVYLEDATITEEFAPTEAFTFRSTLELNNKAFSERFQGDLDEEGQQ
jgi:Tfp pilus assembly protein PilN